MCGVPEPVGRIVISAGEGDGTTRLGQRIGSSALTPGIYLATGSAESPVHEVSAPVSTTFAVVR